MTNLDVRRPEVGSGDPVSRSRPRVLGGRIVQETEVGVSPRNLDGKEPPTKVAKNQEVGLSKLHETWTQDLR